MGKRKMQEQEESRVLFPEALSSVQESVMWPPISSKYSNRNKKYYDHITEKLSCKKKIA